MASSIEVHPVTPERWADFEQLLGRSGGYRGFTGIRSAFDRAGFREVARLANERPVMRKEL